MKQALSLAGVSGGLPPALVPTQQSRELSDPDTLRDIAKHIVKLTGPGDSSPQAVGSQEHTEDWGPVWVPAISPRAHPYVRFRQPYLQLNVLRGWLDILAGVHGCNKADNACA